MKGSIPKGSVWDKLSLDELARQHFIDTLVNNGGLPAPVMNGKPIRANDVYKLDSNISRTTKQESSSGVVGTGLDTNLTITDRKRLGKLFSTRYC